MAIIIEEEQQQSTISIVSIFVWVVILGVVGASVYYLFFKNPDFTLFVTPEGFKNTEALSKINLNPGQVVTSPAFKALRQYTALPEPLNVGRKNPFLEL
ncbi:MAG: hypothetical protein NUV53_01035 [Patescibacteria group bacterium]|nr:hypothetical protein [Patescibacteria group bacterium]